MKILRNLVHVILFGVVAFLGYQYITHRDYVTTETFRDAHQVLNRKVDSLRDQVDFLAKNQDTILMNQEALQDGQEKLISNQDSLKKGQSVIFQEVSNEEGPSLKDFLW